MFSYVKWKYIGLPLLILVKNKVSKVPKVSTVLQRKARELMRMHLSEANEKWIQNSKPIWSCTFCIDTEGWHINMRGVRLTSISFSRSVLVIAAPPALLGRKDQNPARVLYLKSNPNRRNIPCTLTGGASRWRIKVLQEAYFAPFWMTWQGELIEVSIMGTQCMNEKVFWICNSLEF